LSSAQIFAFLVLNELNNYIAALDAAHIRSSSRKPAEIILRSFSYCRLFRSEKRRICSNARIAKRVFKPNSFMQNEWRRGAFTISTERNRLQIDVIHRFLAEESYWAKERTLEKTIKAIENSLCFGVYKGENQIGFARIVTDYATFAYLGDVFVLAEFRNQGLSKWLLQTILAHPGLQGFRRWILATRDAHALYEKFGFTELQSPERWMEKAAPNAY